MSEVTAGTPAPEQPLAAPQPEVTATPGVETKPEEQQPPKTFTQQELDDILEKRLAKERRKREELKRRLEVTEELALRSRPKEEPAKPAVDGEPKRDDFESYEAYIEARADWRADRRWEEKEAKKRDEEAKTRTQAEQQKLEQSFREKARSAAKELEDFEDVMEGSDAPMTQQMAEAILTSDLGPKLAYHLAKNPEEAKRIAALPAARQAAEIGKLEGSLEAESKPKPKPEPSKAPEPIEPVGARSASSERPSDKDDIDTWHKKRLAELEARRKRK
jgi:signal recognition particle GTPase